MSDTRDPDLTPPALIAHTLKVRAEKRTAGEAAALRQGIIAATEMHAMKYTDVYLAGEDEMGRAGWRRAAAICATASYVAQSDHEQRLKLGSSLRMLFNRENPGQQSPQASNAIVAQVNSLPMLDLENAAATLALLIGRCAKQQVPVNFFALGQSLSRWGRGTNSRSRAVRNKIVSDFYQYTSSTSKDIDS